MQTVTVFLEFFIFHIESSVHIELVLSTNLLQRCLLEVHDGEVLTQLTIAFFPLSFLFLEGESVMQSKHPY